ncbi:putative F-box protein At5g36200 [Eutrema salsugineum]|uniref:putative F-box protein At5g36200 n=1 Tax=Eutrema salsugineum TaxID=72664 RepID=UPI000CED05D5|nr:putative F-box protein At5g36200 [Eutrema salsugineum]
MKTMISNLPSELVEEILSRVPVKSMGAVRSTCKTWNSLSKDTSFTNKQIGKASAAREKEFVMIKKYSSVYLVSVNLYETHNNNNNNFDLSINRRGQLSFTATVYCYVYTDRSIIVLSFGTRIGGKEDGSNTKNVLTCLLSDTKNHTVNTKILMFVCYNHLEIYDLSSDSWRRVLNTTLDRNIKIEYGKPSVSLKGNTYWYARGVESRSFFLLCFDFTRERFGPRLALPFDSNVDCDLCLSKVREERLAVLMRRLDTLEMEIWVTNKIEPDEVSWSNFLKVDHMKLLTCFSVLTNFFIEEEKKIAVVFGEGYKRFEACMVGENGYFKRVDLRESADIQLYPFVCSYVPTSVQIL